MAKLRFGIERKIRKSRSNSIGVSQTGVTSAVTAHSRQHARSAICNTVKRNETATVLHQLEVKTVDATMDDPMKRHNNMEDPMTRWNAILLSATIALVAGCGGDDGKKEVVGSCSVVAKSFSACGGEVVGKWRFKDVCGNGTLPGDIPVVDTCPTAKVKAEATWDGEITFNADATFSMVINSQTTNSTFDIPVSCLTDYGGAAMCVSGENGLLGQNATCSVVGGSCVCTSSESEGAVPSSEGTYTAAGNDMVMVDGDSTGGTPMPYCRTGNELVIDYILTDTGGPGLDMYFVLEEK